MTIREVTDGDIRKLREEAREAGDAAMVEYCDEALSQCPDTFAILKCHEAILAARAMGEKA